MSERTQQVWLNIFDNGSGKCFGTKEEAEKDFCKQLDEEGSPDIYKFVVHLVEFSYDDLV